MTPNGFNYEKIRCNNRSEILDTFMTSARNNKRSIVKTRPGSGRSFAMVRLAKLCLENGDPMLAWVPNHELANDTAERLETDIKKSGTNVPNGKAVVVAGKKRTCRKIEEKKGNLKFCAECEYNAAQVTKTDGVENVIWNPDIVKIVQNTPQSELPLVFTQDNSVEYAIRSRTCVYWFLRGIASKHADIVIAQSAYAVGRIRESTSFLSRDYKYIFCDEIHLIMSLIVRNSSQTWDVFVPFRKSGSGRVDTCPSKCVDCKVLVPYGECMDIERILGEYSDVVVQNNNGNKAFKEKKFRSDYKTAVQLYLMMTENDKDTADLPGDQALAEHAKYLERNVLRLGISSVDHFQKYPVWWPRRGPSNENDRRVVDNFIDFLETYSLFTSKKVILHNKTTKVHDVPCGLSVFAQDFDLGLKAYRRLTGGDGSNTHVIWSSGTLDEHVLWRLCDFPPSKRSEWKVIEAILPIDPGQTWEIRVNKMASYSSSTIVNRDRVRNIVGQIAEMADAGHRIVVFLPTKKAKMRYVRVAVTEFQNQLEVAYDGLDIPGHPEYRRVTNDITKPVNIFFSHYRGRFSVGKNLGNEFDRCLLIGNGIRNWSSEGRIWPNVADILDCNIGEEWQQLDKKLHLFQRRDFSDIIEYDHYTSLVQNAFRISRDGTIKRTTIIYSDIHISDFPDYMHDSIIVTDVNGMNVETVISTLPKFTRSRKKPGYWAILPQGKDSTYPKIPPKVFEVAGYLTERGTKIIGGKRLAGLMIRLSERTP